MVKITFRVIFSFAEKIVFEHVLIQEHIRLSYILNQCPEVANNNNSHQILLFTRVTTNLLYIIDLRERKLKNSKQSEIRHNQN